MKIKLAKRPIIAPKKTYTKPKLKVLGNVKKLTLKVGSNTDGMGGFL